MDLKHDIVDTICHASHVIGHNPTVGFPFPIMWGWLALRNNSLLDTHKPPTPKIQLVGLNINKKG